ncbi:MAG: hypothetical protein P1U65_10235 [Minwuia sp.]|nr:hypothetical protein [Minwuia sp.]
MQQGVIQTAVRMPRYVEEAFLSARSVKRLAADVAVTLFTDQPEHLLASTPPFDAVRHLDLVGDDGGAEGGAKRARLAALADSPYERTFALDTDARLVQPGLRQVFAILDRVDIAFAEAQPDASLTRQLLGQPIFNAGVILFRRSEKVQGLLAEWQAALARNLAMADAPEATVKHALVGHIDDPARRRQLLYFDQVALAECFSPVRNPLGLTWARLPETWNWRGGAEERHLIGRPIIDHRPGLRSRHDQDLLRAAFACLREGAQDRSAALYRLIAARVAPNLPSLSRTQLVAEIQRHGLPELSEDRMAELRQTGSVEAMRLATLHAAAGHPRIARTMLDKALEGQ